MSPGTSRPRAASRTPTAPTRPPAWGVHRTTAARTGRAGALALCAAVLAGCEPPTDDVGAWMQSERAQVRASPQPLPAMQPFEPLPYARVDVADPFHPSRLAPARPPAGRIDASLARELERAPQALEAYPLERIAMIGSLVQTGKTEALVRVEGRIHVVRPGDRLGQDRGRIVRIGEQHIELREWVRDEAGRWHERDNRIDLKEAAR